MSDTLPVYRPVRSGEYLLSERGTGSRDVAIVVDGNFSAGTVLGQIVSRNVMTAWDPAGTDGSETATAILYGPARAAALPVKATITARAAEVNGRILQWRAGVTTEQQKAAFAQLGVVGIEVRL